MIDLLIHGRRLKATEQGHRPRIAVRLKVYTSEYCDFLLDAMYSVVSFKSIEVPPKYPLNTERIFPEIKLFPACDVRLTGLRGFHGHKTRRSSEELSLALGHFY